MCLDSITHGPNPTEEGEGYKIFELDGEELYSPYFLRDLSDHDTQSFCQHYETNTWIADSRNYPLVPIDSTDYYQTGFHLFANQADAESILIRWNSSWNTSFYKFVIRKIKYRNVTAKGIQYFDENPHVPAIVAREIFIEEEQTKEE
jgi:hypothetical protein